MKFMVDANIRAVPRPKNTVVVDTGHVGLRQYAVRERAGYSITSGKNVGPRNGKVIGYIYRGAFVPKEVALEASSDESSVYNNVPRMLQYGAAALIHKVCADIYDDLLKVFTFEDSNRLMTIAALRATRPGTAADRYEDKASLSYLSVLYPCRGLECNRIKSFLRQLGSRAKRIADFYSLRMARVSSEHYIFIDGIYMRDAVDINFLLENVQYDFSQRKGFSVLYAYAPHLHEPLCSKVYPSGSPNVYPGGHPNVESFHDFIEENRITKGILVIDESMPFDKLKDVIDAHEDLHYLASVKSNDALLKQYSTMNCDKYATSLSGKQIIYKKVRLDDGRFLYAIRDCKSSNAERSKELHNLLDEDSTAEQAPLNEQHELLDDASITSPEFLNGQCEAYDEESSPYVDLNKGYAALGQTATFVSDLDLDSLLILDYYESRSNLSTVFNHFKNTLDLDITQDQSIYAVIGNEFINSLTAMMTCRILNAFKKLEAEYGKLPYSVSECLEDLGDIDRYSSAPFRGDVNDGYWNLSEPNSTFRLLVELDLAADCTGTVARKKRSDKE